MATVAVIAHAGKTFGGGLPELRRALDVEGVRAPIWHEVPKSKKAPKQVQRAIEEGADLLLVWGGDGLVRRCIDAVGTAEVDIAVLPAGTSNLFGTSLGIPRDVHEAVRIALFGDRIPSGVKVFLLAVAVVDDIIAITVIAAVYTDDLAVGWLVAALAGVLLIVGLRRAGVHRVVFYAMVGVAVWVAVRVLQRATART